MSLRWKAPLVLLFLLVSVFVAPPKSHVTTAAPVFVDDSSGVSERFDHEVPPPMASRSRSLVQVKKPLPPRVKKVVHYEPAAHFSGARLDVTCYTATGHRTASGAWPRVGMAAGNRWPLGTRVRVEHLGVLTITDRIGWGSDLDVFMDSASACKRFGRKHLRVTVLR